jgi:glycosyltransferase involved in cell wall biosynthesis
MGLSVIICTHNPRPDYFSRCLEALREQTLPLNGWELLIIDNASSAEKAPQPDLSWHPKSRLVHEPKLGLTEARLRGFHEASGDLLILVDDDNVLAPDYLEQTLRVAAERPFLGSWGGQCRPGFEEPPSEWTRRYWSLLAIREFDRDVWSNLPDLLVTLPIGAGLCIRQEVALKYLELHRSGNRPLRLDRFEDGLMGCGDQDLAACACDLGLGTGLISALSLTHLIPKERLSVDYLCRLVEGASFSGVVLGHYRSRAEPNETLARKLVTLIRLLFEDRNIARITRAGRRGTERARRLIAAGRTLDGNATLSGHRLHSRPRGG